MIVQDKIKRLQALRSDAKHRLSQILLRKAAPSEPKLRLSILGQCPIAIVKSIRTGVTPDLSAAAGILSAGELFENFIYEAYDGFEVIRQYEVELAGIKGHIDFYFPQLHFLIECKTISTARCSQDFLPIPQHEVQVHAYLSALYEMTQVEHDALLIYIPRENPHPSLIQIFTYSYDPAWHSEIVLRIELLRHAIETGEIPPIPAEYSANKYPCLWFSKISRMQMRCPFWEECWTTRRTEAKAEKEQEASQGNDESFDTYEMDQELEDLVALLYALRTQKKTIEAQEKDVRAEILKAIKKKQGRWLSKEFALTVVEEVRRQLDTQKLAQIVPNLDEFKKEVKVTIVDVAKIA